MGALLSSMEPDFAIGGKERKAKQNKKILIYEL